MIYAGDETHGDEITSGQYYQYEGLTKTEREKIIHALYLLGEYDKPTLRVMDDEELLELADEYGV